MREVQCWVHTVVDEGLIVHCGGRLNVLKRKAVLSCWFGCFHCPSLEFLETGRFLTLPFFLVKIEERKAFLNF